MDHSHWSQHEPMTGSRIVYYRKVTFLLYSSALTDHIKEKVLKRKHTQGTQSR